MLIALIDRLSRAPESRLRRALIPVLQGAAAPGSRLAVVLQEERQDPDTAERRNLIVAGAGIAAEKPRRSIEILEAFLAAEDGPAHPRIYERLAEAYVLTQRPTNAEQVLQRALTAHPDDVGLQLALAGAFASGSNWDAAIDRWQQLPGFAKDGANLWTQVGIARAYRHIGKPEEAVAIAVGAETAWPHNQALQREIQLSRPSLIDWKDSWKGSAATRRKIRDGDSVVDALGFMNGGSSPIRGSLASCSSERPEVSLTVNDRTIATTVAADSPEHPGRKSFSINCADVLQFVGNGDTIKIVCDGNAVPLPNLGAHATLDCDHDSDIEDLFGRLNRGFVFTKNGALRPGNDDQSKIRLLELFARCSALVLKHADQSLYPFYGNLLGTIRENDFIGHDVGGFDALYLCKGDSPTAVKAEFAELCSLFAEHQFHLTIKPHSVMVRMAYGDEAFVDMSFGWFGAEDELNVSFGSRCGAARGRDRFLHRRHCRLFDREVLVPGNSEAVLEQLYGPGWRIPDQGFSAHEQLHRDEAFLLSKQELLALKARTEQRT